MKNTKILEKIILVIIVFGLFPTIYAQEFINLSEMEVSLAQQTYSAPVVNKAASGDKNLYWWNPIFERSWSLCRVINKN